MIDIKAEGEGWKMLVSGKIKQYIKAEKKQVEENVKKIKKG